MNTSREGLLQPTLNSESPPATAPYSVQATFFTGFFGGPFAAIVLIAVNSGRLRRLGRDLPALAACLLVVLLLGWVLHVGAPGAPAREWLDANLGERNYRYVHRFVALIVVGVGYLLHRREQRNADLLGLDRPNGWAAGTLCAVLGGVALAALLAVVTRT